MYGLQATIKKTEMARRNVKNTTVKKLPQKGNAQTPQTPLAPAAQNPILQNIPPKKTYASAVKEDLPHSKEIGTTFDDSLQTMTRDSVQLNPSPLLSNQEVAIWTPPPYRELILPQMWKTHAKIPFGMNRIVLRGAVVTAPSIVTTGKEKTLRLGKMLVKVWNGYAKTPTEVYTEDNFMRQSHTATIFVVGFEEVSDAIGKFTVGDLVEVSGYLSTRSYMRKVDVEDAQFEVKTYDTTVIARGLTKFMDVELAQDAEWEIPETQLHDD